MLKAGREVRNRRNGCAHVRPAAILGLAVLALMCGPAARSQAGAANPFGFPEHNPHTFPHPAVSSGGDMDRVTTVRQRIAVNIERQKQIVADSDKLLKLARELNDEVAAAGSRSLTAEQLEKLNEIERLARSVKERMLDEVEDPRPPVSQSQTQF